MENIRFLGSLASCLAHSLVFYAREACVVEMRCEDGSAPSTRTSAASLAKALGQYLPQLTSAYTSALGPVEQAQIDSAKSISPQYYDLLTELMGTYGPRLATLGAEQEAAVKRAGAESDLALLQGAGGGLVRTAEGLSRELNPEYYNSRATAGAKVDELLNSINLDAPNVEAERLVSQEAARSGNLATPSATSTVGNALSFGNELQKRRDALSNAINTATNFLTTSKSSFGPEMATQRSGSNTGTAQFSGVTQPTGQGFDIADSFLNNLTGLRNTEMNVNSQRRDWIDRVNEGFGSL